MCDSSAFLNLHDVPCSCGSIRPCGVVRPVRLAYSPPGTTHGGRIGPPARASAKRFLIIPLKKKKKGRTTTMTRKKEADGQGTSGSLNLSDRRMLPLD